MGRCRRRCKQLLDDLKETRGHCKSTEEALDHPLWRTSFGRGYGPVVRQTTERMNCLKLHKFHFSLWKIRDYSYSANYLTKYSAFKKVRYTSAFTTMKCTAYPHNATKQNAHLQT
jgi:hypothetical protein